MTEDRFLFWWWSEALKEYARGKIVVVAHNSVEAREKALAEIEAWLREQHEWMFLDDDDRDEFDAFMTKFRLDLEAEPQIEDVLFVRGSE